MGMVKGQFPPNNLDHISCLINTHLDNSKCETKPIIHVIPTKHDLKTEGINYKEPSNVFIPTSISVNRVTIWLYIYNKVL